ncbi:MAG TPA: beta-propeller fold lactonase family protein [Geminicoccaceae bacterium]|nr:beta-propeller fold lactonase family protein [Geminicoccaceae bacterium]
MSQLARSITCAGMLAILATRPGLALDASDPYVFVPNRASADVAVIDSRTDRLVARIPVGNVPHQVAVSDVAGKLVATNTADDTISIVDLATLDTKTLSLGHEPEHMALAPDGVLLAIGNIAGGTVSLVSLEGDTEIARVAGLFDPHNLTFSPDGSLLYVANLGADHVSVIDVAAARVIDEIEVAEPPALAGTEDAGAEFQGIINVTSTPDGRFGFAAHGEGGRLAVIDLRTRQLKKNLELGALPWRAYGTADGRYMLVPNNGDRTLSVIATATLEVVTTLPAAADVTGINTGWFETTAFALSRAEAKAVVYDLEAMAKVAEIALPGTPETGVTTPDGAKLYVALSDTDQVAVIDVRARKLSGTIDRVGDEPWGATMIGALNYCH